MTPPLPRCPAPGGVVASFVVRAGQQVMLTVGTGAPATSESRIMALSRRCARTRAALFLLAGIVSAAAVRAPAIALQAHDIQRHKRFDYSGSKVTLDGYLLAPFRHEGVGYLCTLVSDQFIVGASHAQASEFLGYDPAGNEIRRTVVQRWQLGDDVYLGKLESPVDTNAVPPVPILVLDDYADYTGLESLNCGQFAAGRRVVTSASGVNVVFNQAKYLGPDSSYCVGGDSGNASLVAVGNRLTLLGSHWYPGSDSPVIAKVAAMCAIMTNHLPTIVKTSVNGTEPCPVLLVPRADVFGNRWTGGSAAWTAADASRWDAGLPTPWQLLRLQRSTAGDQTVTFDATSAMTGDAAARGTRFGNVLLGHTAGGTSRLRVGAGKTLACARVHVESGGELELSGGLVTPEWDVVVMTGGRVVHSNGVLRSRTQASSVSMTGGTYDLHSGHVDIRTNQYVWITNGIFTARGGVVGNGRYQGRVEVFGPLGLYHVTGGTTDVDKLTIDKGAQAVQDGGHLVGVPIDVVNGSLRLNAGTIGAPSYNGISVGSSGVVRQASGYACTPNFLNIYGRHELGDTSGSATIAAHLKVYPDGVLVGSGRLDGRKKQCDLSGLCIADGRGPVQELDFDAAVVAGNSGFYNKTDNPRDGTNGWYAVHGGRLRFPDVGGASAYAVKASLGPAFNVGETQHTSALGTHDTQIDLVNSARFTFTGLGESNGVLSSSLYDPARADVPPVPGDPVSVHRFDLASNTFTSASLSIRYDHATARTNREDRIRLYRHDGTAWQLLPATLDPSNRCVNVSGLTSLGLFAVAVERDTNLVARVTDIAMGTSTFLFWTRGSASVRVVDINGDPLPGAVVSGSWSGVVSGGSTGTTGADGRVGFSSGYATSTGVFRFTVTGVTTPVEHAFDADGSILTAAVETTVSPANRSPLAQPQALTATGGVARAVTLGATDPDGNPLTYAVVDAPAHGSLSGLPPALVYSPAPGYLGADRFTFKANDGRLDSNVAVVRIDVQSPIPAAWLTAHGLPAGEPPHGDPDHDTFCTFDEYIADTHPADGLSYLRVGAVRLGASVQVEFLPSSPNRVYTLQHRTSLTEGTWADVPGATRVTGTGGTQPLAGTPAGDGGHYRVEVELP